MKTKEPGDILRDAIAVLESETDPSSGARSFAFATLCASLRGAAQTLDRSRSAPAPALPEDPGPEQMATRVYEESFDSFSGKQTVDAIAAAIRAAVEGERALERAACDPKWGKYAGHLVDYPGTARVDPLGTSLAVLYDVVDDRYHPSLLRALQTVDSPYGVTIQCKHNPLNAEEAQMIERTQGVVVWPFIVGFTVLALCKMAEDNRATDIMHGIYREAALQQFGKLSKQQGFWEYYDPSDGKGYGAEEQLWSAVLYLRAAAAIGKLCGVYEDA